MMKTRKRVVSIYMSSFTSQICNASIFNQRIIALDLVVPLFITENTQAHGIDGVAEDPEMLYDP